MNNALRVMSFNIRYAEPDDGAHVWENRRALLARVILDAEPDVAGLQEPEIDQLKWLDHALRGYRRFGVSRMGNEVEKFTAIYYRASAITLIESGAFWVSPTPDRPATMDWGLHKPYAINWGWLEQTGTAKRFWHFNTHFPYMRHQALARLEAARLLNERAGRIQGRVFVTGDFNTIAGSGIHERLLDHFSDAWLTCPRRLGPPGTMHGFTGVPRGRIDWVLYRGDVEVEQVEVITRSEGSLYPSDHFPVLVTARL